MVGDGVVGVVVVMVGGFVVVVGVAVLVVGRGCGWCVCGSSFLVNVVVVSIV